MKRKRLRKFMVRKLSLLVFLVGTLFVSLISISYALVNARITGVTHYSVKIGTLAFEIQDEENAIRLLNAYPMTDNKGKTLKPYAFTLTNTGTLKEYYQILIIEDTEEKAACTNCKFLTPDKIRYSLTTNGTDGDSQYLNSDKAVIEVGELAKNETKNYELRLWLDEGATIDEEDKLYYGKLQIEASQEPYENYETKPNPPELAKNMLPIVYNEGSWKVADTRTRWYDYSKQEWANAVTVVASERDTYFDEDGDLLDDAIGKDVPETSMNTWWVWIPRYSYTIKSEDGGSYYGRKLNEEDQNPTASLPGAIDIKFIDKYKTDTGTAQYSEEVPIDGTWRTPDGFRFGDQRVSGIWVGKFELSHKTSSSDTSNNNLNCIESKENCERADGLEILPNKVSLRYNNVANFFYAIKSMQRVGNPFGFVTDQNKVDIHMIKNSEWGVTAYLSQSKYGKYGNNMYTETNKEIYKNNSTSFYTGSSSGKIPMTESSSSSTCKYDDIENRNDGTGSCGGGASTTGNITGIYDMSGGAWEYVMGVLSDGENPRSGYDSSSNSGFSGMDKDNGHIVGTSFPEVKYYDLYKSTEPSSEEGNLTKTACNLGICFGHALSETSKWYNDDIAFVSYNNPWVIRGGSRGGDLAAGIFYSGRYYGSAHDYASTHAVLISF